LTATNTEYRLAAENYQELIDSPVELAIQQQASFDVAGIPHRIAISGRHNTNIDRLSQDLTKICQTEIAMFGEAPFDDYLFMVMATANSYGGLEHQKSTSLISPRDDLPKLNEPEKPSSSYQRFLGLCSHEYFHSWLVKYIRPHNFVDMNLHEEGYTPLLWIFEGFTSYYDDLILYRSGVIDRDAYLTLLTEQINRYYQNPGRHIQSVAESSFDAWIKYYRQDENSGNAGTSYYNKGALVALSLDLTLRKAGCTLDDVMRQLFARAQQGQPVHEDTIAELCEQLTGQSFEPFIQQYVVGTVELPLKELLSDFGIELKTEQKLWPMGLKVQENAQGLLVQQVLRHSAAAKAGVSAQDIIIAVNGLKVSLSMIQQINHSDACGKIVECHAFRRDELKTFQIEVVGEAFNQAQLTVINPEHVLCWLPD
jgi:predicted metalloprotease with PDZ domain